MSVDPVILRAFASGEIAPALAARADLVKYQLGLRTCRNFQVQRHGGVANRAGFRFIGECKTDDPEVMLLRYVSEVPGESVLIEAGEGYFRFWQNGARVEVVTADITAWSGATAYVVGDLASRLGIVYYCIQAHTNQQPPNATFWSALPASGSNSVYEIPHPYVDMPFFNWVQSGRVITLTHPDFQPRDLIFQALTRWVLVPIDTQPKVGPPQNVVLTNTAGARSYGYVITAAAPDTYEESEASAQVIDASAAEPTPDAPHQLSWDVVLTPPLTGDPSPEYYVYCDPYGNGTYGFIGTATGAASFRNAGFSPDFAITPPLPRILFTTADEFPAVCAYYQQRRFLANTNNVPDAVFASRIGFPDNFGISSPLQDDDAITFRLAGNNAHAVRHALGLKTLLLLTDGGEWSVGEPKVPISPFSIPADQETYVGIARDVRPVVIGNSIIYLQARKTVIHDLQFDQQVEGLGGRDLTVFAAHLFDGRTIEDMDYAQSPNSIVWAVRSDGTLLGLTYLREQDIWGWHRHNTGASGRFERVCVVPELERDALYAIVRRTIGTTTKRYIERLEPREIVTWDEDVFFVDSGLSYSGSPVTSVGGLGHLVGQVVAVVGDGTVVYDGDPDGTQAGAFTVPGSGTIALGAPYSNVHVGLPIRFADVETLDLDVAGSNIRAKEKRVQFVRMLLETSARTFKIGPDSGALVRHRIATSDSQAQNFTGAVEENLTTYFNDHGRVFIRHTDPLPLTILALIPQVEANP